MKKTFRDFEKLKCHSFYAKLRELQTLNNVQKLEQIYTPTLDGCTKINVWDAMNTLSKLVDASDPDSDIPNLHHAFQTAIGAQLSGAPEWLQVIALIHDLGKMLYTHPKARDEHGTTLDTQYAVVGDTFPVGCQLSDGLVLSQYNKLNSDMWDPTYNTKYGIYSEGIGFDNCKFSWGHDEYLYRVIKHNILHNPEFDWKIPKEGLYIIRYHSFYPWHSPIGVGGDDSDGDGDENTKERPYEYLASDYDKQMLPTLQEFSSYDLYTKQDTAFTEEKIEELKEYFNELIQKYIGTLNWYF